MIVPNLGGCQIDSISIFTHYNGISTNLYLSDSGALKVIQHNDIKGLTKREHIVGLAYQNKIDSTHIRELFQNINHFDKCEGCYELRNSSNNIECVCVDGIVTHTVISNLKLYTKGEWNYTFDFYPLHDQQRKPELLSVFNQIFQLTNYPNKTKWDPANFAIEELKAEKILSMKLIKRVRINKYDIKNSSEHYIQKSDYQTIVDFYNLGSRYCAFGKEEIREINDYEKYYVLLIEKQHSASRKSLYYIDDKFVRTSIYSWIPIDDNIRNLIEKYTKN